MTAALAATALAQDNSPQLAYEKDQEAASVEVIGRLWMPDGYTESESTSFGGKFERNRNVMAILEAEAQLPGQPWISVWGRIGQSLSDSNGEVNKDQDSKASFGLFELNLGVSLAGRGSPLAPEHALPESYFQAYAGVRAFRESFDCDNAGGGDSTYKALWFGPQLGVRGYWHLWDTYRDEDLRGWGLSAGAAVMPWMMVDADVDIDGGTSATQKSEQGFGYSWFVGTSYRSGRLSLGLGYEAQYLKTDDGDENVSGGQLYHLYSVRHGPFLSLGVRF